MSCEGVVFNHQMNESTNRQGSSKWRLRREIGAVSGWMDRSVEMSRVGFENRHVTLHTLGSSFAGLLLPVIACSLSFVVRRRVSHVHLRHLQTDTHMSSSHLTPCLLSPKTRKETPEAAFPQSGCSNVLPISLQGSSRLDRGKPRAKCIKNEEFFIVDKHH